MQQDNSKLSVACGGCSLTGARDENQDAFLVKLPTLSRDLTHKGVVACIADGVSCSENSQKASNTAVMQFISDYFATPDSWSVKHAAGHILTSMNAWLFENGSKQSLTHNGLVTTFSALILKSNTAHLLHVGDSRIYRLRGHQLRQLTRDHQRVNFGQQAYLTRALGMDSNVDVDYQTLPLEINDRFILTTDGVHDFLPESTLVELLQDTDSEDLEATCTDICHQAIDQGSLDNVTCLILDVKTLPAESLVEHQAEVLFRAIPPAMEASNTIDGYRILEVLHAGSRSHVYRIHDPSADLELVMKVPSINYSDDHDYLRCFANEYWVASQLKNDRVMKMYPPPRDSRFSYQLCEFIDGITLRQWMYDNPLPSLQAVRRILDELIKAIRVFQRADMVHRDLKPENVMIMPDGKVKVIDFGAVQVKGLEEIDAQDRAAIPLGTVDYTAPEYISTGNAVTASDLFSTAVIGYEMLTGELPYKTASSQSLSSARHIKWSYRSMLHFRDDIPKWVDLVFEKATHPDPGRRYRVLSEFVADLFTPNQGLQKEFQKRPLLQRDPVIVWKSIALISTAIAIFELTLLL